MLQLDSDVKALPNSKSDEKRVETLKQMLPMKLKCRGCTTLVPTLCCIEKYKVYVSQYLFYTMDNALKLL